MTKLRLLSKRTALIAAILGVITFTSCEKDNETNPLSGHSATEGKSSSASNNDKSGEFPEGYWDDLSTYISNVMNEGELNEMLAEQAFYYTESALDWRLSGRDDILQSREDGVTLFYTQSLFADQNGDVKISADDLALLNSNIYTDISNQASALSASSGTEVTVDNIDLEWEINYASNSANITVSALYGLVGGTSRCWGPFSDAKAINPEKCDGTPYQNAAKVIDAYTSTLCGTWRNPISCNTNTHAITNIRNTTVNSYSPQGSFLWTGTNPDECRTANQNQSDFDDARALWNNTPNSFPGSIIKTAWYNSKAPTIINPTGSHDVSYITVNCVRVCEGPSCSEDSRPQPIF